MNKCDASTSEKEHHPAGDFSVWLRQFRASLVDGVGVDVACGECVGCCSSSQFIHIRPSDSNTLKHVPKPLLFSAPGLPEGHRLMGYDQQGRCPMLSNGTCTIYQHRPQTCRNYDCRLFAAAGIEAGGDEKAFINDRVKRWRFSYPTEKDKEEQQALREAVRFIREHADCFPGGRVPEASGQLAIVAVKAYKIFLPSVQGESVSGNKPSNTELAAAVVETCSRFDALMAEQPV